MCNSFTISKHFQNFTWFLQQPYEIGLVSSIFRVSKSQLTVVIKRGKQNLYQSFMTLEGPTCFFSTGQHFSRHFLVVNTVTLFRSRLLYINKTFTEYQWYRALCMAKLNINIGLYSMFLSSSDIFHLDNLRCLPKFKRIILYKP